MWERVGSPIRNEGVTRQFSWGKAVVFPNAGLIELEVRDEAIEGSGAFVKVLFTPHPDGTATIDFQRRDGTLFGAADYERRYGPATE